MDKDIKVLQNIVERCKGCKFATCEQCEINWKQVQAIENLIEGYKDLEKRYKIRKEIYNRDIKAVDEKWKSKVREKIEALDDIESEYSKKIIEAPTGLVTGVVQYAFKELLQEGDE